LLQPDIGWGFNAALRVVRERIIAVLLGDAWKGTVTG